MEILQKDFEELSLLDINFNEFKNTTFLVTGATGLIGSLMIKSLLFLNKRFNLNVQVIAVIRNLDKAKKIFGSNVGSLVTFLVADLNVDELVIEKNVDYVLHAAATTTSKLLVNYPVEAIKTSVDGTQKILELAKKKQVKKVIYLSSMEVYGQMNTDGKVNEDELGSISLSNVRSGYPESKRLCELLCRSYSSEYGVPVVIARLAQTFGAGILPSENRVFAQFARSVINNQDIILHTLGNSEGNYIYTMDAIGAFFILFLKGKDGEAYNVSNPDNHLTIKKMAELVANNFSKGKVVSVKVELPDRDRNYGYAPDTKMWLDNAKLVKLGWAPKVNLVESYTRMISWMKESGV